MMRGAWRIILVVPKWMGRQASWSGDIGGSVEGNRCARNRIEKVNMLIRSLVLLGGWWSSWK
jgi:hypothetical protein